MAPQVLLGLDFLKKNISYIMFDEQQGIRLKQKTPKTQIIELKEEEYLQIIATDYLCAPTKEYQFNVLVNLISEIPEKQPRKNLMSVKFDHQVRDIQKVEIPDDSGFDFAQVIGIEEPTQRQQIIEVLNKYRHLFAFKMSDLTLAKGVEHEIELTTDIPIKRPPYRVSHKEREVIENQIKEMLDSQVIRPSNSPFSSPIVLVKKKDGSLRFCIDYRELNKITRKDNYPLPIVNDLIHALQGAKFISTLDMFSGYYQIGIAEHDKHKTAFISCKGLYEFNRLSFGLTNGPATYQRMINNVFNDMLYSSVLAFLDDVIIFSRSFSDHLKHLENAFNKVEEFNLRMKPSKCTFLTKETYFLGFIISPDGIKSDPKKIESVRNFGRPRTQRDIRAFLGLTGYYRCMIKNYGDIAKPLTDLLKKECKTKIEWNEKLEASFQELKSRLITAPILSHYLPGHQLILYTDASNYAMGWILCQIQEEKERVLEFGSKLFNSTQLNYCTSDKEMLSIVTAVLKLRHFLSGEQFIIRTDHHALCFLMKVKDPSQRLTRYALRLMEFDFKIEYKSGKSHGHVDALSRYPDTSDSRDKNEDYEELPVYLAMIETPVLNSGRCTSDCILQHEVEPYYHEIADYTIAVLPELNMQWKENVFVTEYPKNNQLFLPKLLPEPANHESCFATLDEYDMRKAQLSDPWCLPIIKAIENNNPKTLKRFVLKNGILYKKTFDDYGQPKDLLCLPRELRQLVLKEVHGGLIGGGHFGYFKTNAKIRDRYFYPKRDKSVRNFIMSCTCCQFRKNDGIHKKGLLQPIRIGKPFDLVGIDIMGPYPESGRRKYQFIIVAVDFATRLTITKAVKEATKEEVADFIIYNIVLRFGAPRRILTDNGSQFTSHTLQSVLDFINTEHSYSQPYHPQTNGIVERTNQTLLNSISTYTSDSDQTNWSKVLPFVEFSHNSAKSKSLKFSPFFALFGYEPTTFLDVNLKLEIDTDLKFTPEYITTARHLISENLKDAQYKQKEEYDKKHTDYKFNIGDLVKVYKKVRRKGVNEKMMAKYHGPFKVIQIYQKPKDYYLIAALDHPDYREKAHISKLYKWREREEEDWDPLENIQLVSRGPKTEERPGYAFENPDSGQGSETPGNELIPEPGSGENENTMTGQAPEVQGAASEVLDAKSHETKE